MKLFEDKERTRTEPKAPGEDEYAFYDSCARPGYDDYRARLNGWLTEMPQTAQKDLIPRFRKNESLEYQRALAELTVHAALKRQGYSVEVHPESKDTDRKPDFVAKDAQGLTVAYRRQDARCPRSPAKNSALGRSDRKRPATISAFGLLACLASGSLADAYPRKRPRTRQKMC